MHTYLCRISIQGSTVLSYGGARFNSLIRGLLRNMFVLEQCKFRENPKSNARALHVDVWNDFDAVRISGHSSNYTLTLVACGKRTCKQALDKAKP